MTEENNKQNEQLQDNSGDTAIEQSSDAGYKFLSDALRASFLLLKVIMVILLILFLVSGFESIGPDEKAMVLRFGRIRGEAEKRILGPGLKWVWPYPIEEIIRIPVAKKTNLAFEGFWYYLSPKEKLDEGPKNRQHVNPKLNPIRDGYCITRSQEQSIAGESGSDYNIVHTKWQLTYQVRDPELFFTNAYINLADIEAGQNYADVITKNITPLLEDLLADAVVTAMVNYTIDDALFEQIGTITDHVKRLLQKKLDKIESGIAIVSIQLDDKIWPRQVNDAFWKSIQASNIREKTVSEARTYYDKTLNEVAGRVAEELLVAIESSQENEQIESLWLQLAGQAQDEIAQAQAYRTKVVEEARANSDYFRNLLPEYRERPELVVQKIYQDTVQQVLENAEEKIIIQPTHSAKGKEIRIQMNRDPAIKKDSEQESEK